MSIGRLFGSDPLWWTPASKTKGWLSQSSSRLTMISGSGGYLKTFIDKLFVSRFPCCTALTVNMLPNNIKEFPPLPEITPELTLFDIWTYQGGKRSCCSSTIIQLRTRGHFFHTPFPPFDSRNIIGTLRQIRVLFRSSGEICAKKVGQHLSTEGGLVIKFGPSVGYGSQGRL